VLAADLERLLTAGRCLVDEKKIKHGDWLLQTIDICTQPDNYILQDGFKSFPSGHSSGRLNRVAFQTNH
jgi:membrane-associated phospholipid phosphatase